MEKQIWRHEHKDTLSPLFGNYSYAILTEYQLHVTDILDYQSQRKWARMANHAPFISQGWQIIQCFHRHLLSRLKETKKESM